MPALFDAYVMVDWSAAAVPATGADSVWIASAERCDGALTPLRLANPRTRREAAALLADLLSDLVARDYVTLVGFDFAFGYPAGFAQRLHRPGADWRSVWREIAARVRDADNNANNRFEVAAALNQRISGRPFPFWGCPATAAGPLLAARKPAGYGDLAEFRMCDLAGGGAHPVWKLAYSGCVGSQTLLGIAHLQALRQHPWLADITRVWPFETGLRAVQRPAAGEWRLLFAEIYPSIFDSRSAGHAIKDARQVQTVVERLRLLDDAGRLAPLFAGPPTLTSEQRLAIETEEGWILGIETTDRQRRARAASITPAAGYDYVRDPEEIYRRSFAAIRAEADLSALPANLEPLAVRLIHAAGDSGIVRDLAWTEDAFAAGRRALAGGAPILVDTEMVAAGIMRARLPAENPVVCTLAEPDLAEAAQAIGNTRSAAAVDRWLDRLAGAVVAIGNAPTALFRLLELLDGGAPRPAVILGFPVGFVGATEAKEALIAHPLRVPFVTLRGRRGGSAMAAAAVNALAGDAV
jgi:precorrin-8X/cobalt-precorrin-8 methylmutase